MNMIDRLTEFRLQAAEFLPYMAHYVFSLTPVQRHGLGTMAVDKGGRMYYDPVWCDKLTVQEGGYVVLHEALHLALRHCDRALLTLGTKASPKERLNYNIAVDIVVWEMLEGIAQHSPEGGVTLAKAMAKWPAIVPNSTTAETLYPIINTPPPPKPEEEDEEEEEEEEEEKEKRKGGGQGGEDEGEGEGEETEEGNCEGDFEAEEEAEGKGKGQGKSKGKGDSPAEPEDSKPEPDEDFKLIGGGSAADGQENDYEEAPSDTWDSYVEDELLEDMEERIKEWEESTRGTAPAGLKTAIESKLRPQPNPWDKLRATVAKAIANHRGAPDYSYSKMNRRQNASPNMPRLKGPKKYAPSAVVVVDTSGSMSAACLAKAVVVIKQGLVVLGQVPVICCDAQVTGDEVMRSVGQTFEFTGGGGTDMRIPLAYAEKKYHPDVIVLVTDTDTPWPEKKMRGQLIVAATRDGSVPSWAVKVRIPDTETK